MSILNLNLDIPDWPEAACIGADPSLFYPDDSVPAIDAKAICSRCPIREACLQWALDRNDHNGVWGGLSGKERKTKQQETGKRACRSCKAAIPAGYQLCDSCRNEERASRTLRYRQRVAA